MAFERFGKYLLLERIASGGMAEVYLAKTIGLNNFVAIKRILPQFSQNPEFLVMFREEAQIVANLRHSNIVSIHYFGQEKGQLFLVMDFVEGQNLRQILNTLKKEGSYFGLDQITYLVREVAAGLDYAHRALDNATGKPLNIIHRDMSPQNIMVSFEGEVKIVDFGIAKAETQLEHTQAGVIKGKFGYMSPEQAEGLPLDGRTDVFSLGVILWELLTKERLFVGSNEAATLKKVRDCQIPSIRKIDPNVPQELERIAMKALSKSLDMRYASAQAMHRDLNRFLNTQFPEFSKTDFSKFMKTIYRDMYLENRKKFSEYSQINLDVTDSGEEKTKTLTASVSTVQEVTGDITGSESIPGLESEPVSEPIEVDSLKIPLEVPPSPPQENMDNNAVSSVPQHTTQTQSRSISHTKTVTQLSEIVHTDRQPISQNTASASIFRTNSGIRKTKPSHSNTIYTYAVVALVIILGSFVYFMVTKDKKNSLRVFEMSSKNTPITSSKIVDTSGNSRTNRQRIASLTVYSQPDRAVVEINGKQVGFTPYRGSIYSSEEVKITIRKENYIPYEQVLKVDYDNPMRLDVNLTPEPPKGYLSIEIIGGTNDTIVEIAGQRVTDLSKLDLYPVPAKVPVEIRAYNSFNGTEGIAKVTVNVNEKKKIRIIMIRQSETK